MRTLNRNKSTFYYAKLEKSVAIKDEWGNFTGEYETRYGLPIECKGNISSANGSVQTEMFGFTESYSKVIVLEERDIDESSILWIDRKPITENEKRVPHDYIVSQIAKSLNGVSIAIRKVNTSGDLYDRFG